MLRIFTYYVSRQHVPVYLSFILQMQVIQGYTYIGCFKDNKTRDLDVFGPKWIDSNTPEKCIKLCRKYNTHYAGLQFEKQCFCGNAYGKYGQVNESSCNRDCPGDTTKKCGGDYANTVYEIVPRTTKTLIPTVEPAYSVATVISNGSSTKSDATSSQPFSLSSVLPHTDTPSVVNYENTSMFYSTHVPSTEISNFPSVALVVIIIIIIIVVLSLLVVGTVLLKRKKVIR